ANLFVAAFIGSPSMNMVEARIEADTVSFAGFALPLPPGRNLSAHRGRTVILGIRPSDFEDADVWHREGLPLLEVAPDVTAWPARPSAPAGRRPPLCVAPLEDARSSRSPDVAERASAKLD